MRTTIAALTLLTFLGTATVASAQEQKSASGVQTPASTPTLVAFASKESQNRLTRSQAKVDFFELAGEYEAQMNAGTCGPTSAVIVLNALRPQTDARRPVDRTAFPEERWKMLPAGWSPVKPRYTQRAFLVDERLTAVKSFERFYGEKDESGQRDPGLQLEELYKILVLNGLDVTLGIVTDETTDAEVKKAMIANLKRADDYVIINYHRKALGQPGGGHISPVAAYDEQSDSFLVMDTNPNKAPWVWVDAADLIAAMRTFDKTQNRGYLLVREGAPQ